MVSTAIIFLIAAVIAVPIFKKLGLGSVLGYLTAGIIIGPSVLGLITEVEDILHVSELGIVLLLFIIGLELQPARLWLLRKPIFGIGALQVTATALVIYFAMIMLDMRWQTAVLIGCCLALSSTAFALQLLAEKNQLITQHGRTAFAILLFQDLIVIPMLALLPLLAPEGGVELSNQQLFLNGTKIIAIITALIFAGHYLIQPLLRLVAQAKNPELLSAASLLLVLGTAALMHAIGLSMALGAFLAGVLLSSSEFRHELEANIEPFKGLLLGLFFIAIGMTVDLSLLIAKPVLLVSLAVALVALKGLILFGIAKLNKQPNSSAINLAIVISQGGEFAFVLLHQANILHIVEHDLINMVTLVVTLSMVITPLLLLFNEFIEQKQPTQNQIPNYDDIDDDEPKVIIAGFGRFGQMTARILRVKRIPFTALESNFEQVDFVRKFGNKIYFGDAARLDLLRAAKAGQAHVFVLSIVDIETSLKVAESVKKHFPHLKIYARARNRQHVYKLMDIGVDYVIRETFLSSVELAKQVLQSLSVEKKEANFIANAFIEHDEDLIKKQHAVYTDEKEIIATSKRAAAELQSLFEEDGGSSMPKK